MTATEQYFHVVLFLMLYIYALLTKHEVKMAGYWPSSFFFAFLWTETKSRSIKMQKKKKKKKKKKERGQYPAILTAQAWSIKDLNIIWLLIFKLKLQQQNKTQHETVLLGKKFFIAGQYKIYFQCIFGLACNHGKKGILNYFKAFTL